MAYNIFMNVLEPNYYCYNLRGVKHSPKKLYFLGNKLLFKEKYFLAVVGPRQTSIYGKKALRFILPEIAKRKIVIVSGLARGIDILAHQIALENNCPTIAVLAGGLDDIYPPEHRIYAQEIIKSGGLIVSEHPPGTAYLRQYFPARNRIISGISDATLVVEAGKKSGALITAGFALQQKRKLFAVPGNVFSSVSQGSNSLLGKGATPVQDSEDILKYFFPKRRRYKSISSGNSNGQSEGVNLNQEEQKILKFISADSPTPVNLIIRQTGFSAAKVIAVTTQLELKGLIELIGGQGFVKLQ